MGPYQPTLIIHGGAGNISRPNLPPALYDRYHASLLEYLTSTRELLDRGANAVDAACHAVSLMEDDPLFNCGRGSVFTVDGGIEMEASLMVSSVSDFILADQESSGMRKTASSINQKKLIGRTKKSAAVSMIRRTRHPILLAREVLGMADDAQCKHDPESTDLYEGCVQRSACAQGKSSMRLDIGQMHGHLSGQGVEEWGFRERGLERKGYQWFWTRKRWEEHRRGLGLDISDRAWMQKLGKGPSDVEAAEEETEVWDGLHGCDGLDDVKEVPSQGTVGAVCMDSWGNLCVATSTGGLTNKRSGRIGDTPTVGAGFWAESWDERISIPTRSPRLTATDQIWKIAAQSADFWFGDCVPNVHRPSTLTPSQSTPSIGPSPYVQEAQGRPNYNVRMGCMKPGDGPGTETLRRRAVAMSGTGNGDSFLRVNAARTAAAISRFSSSSASPDLVPTLQEGVTVIAGPGGELQRSAEDRWGCTGEGEGGIIGIEVVKIISEDVDNGPYQAGLEAHVAFDFNCGGMWRAYYETEQNGELKPKIMVFKGEYPK